MLHLTWYAAIPAIQGAIHAFFSQESQGMLQDPTVEILTTLTLACPVASSRGYSKDICQ